MSVRSAGIRIEQKVASYNWQLFGTVSLFTAIGIILLYSAGFNNEESWALKQLYTALIFIPIMLFIGFIDIKTFYDQAYLLYAVGLVLLIIAEILGYKAMGAQRWIRLGPINFQPSEFMKLFVILALARYFHQLHTNEIGVIPKLFIPVLIVLVPAALILKQPNLGTASIILLIGASMFFLAGVRVWKFVTLGVLAMISMPIIWGFMHDYQKKRVLTFLDPESDPLGSGYNIIQSMIAIGSGGFWGKSYMKGSQSQLNFIPEKQTDFIFSVLAEEFGFLGVVAIFALSTYLIYCCYHIALHTKGQFQRLVTLGVATTFFLHLVINTAMISGSIPVVGTPFPFLSYGRSNLITMLIGFGIVLSACHSGNTQRRASRF
jgi:rod shape determining protein RodA